MDTLVVNVALLVGCYQGGMWTVRRNPLCSFLITSYRPSPLMFSSLSFFLPLSFNLYFSLFLSFFHILFPVFLYPFCIIVSLASVWWILRVRHKKNSGALPAVEFLTSICAHMNNQIFTSWYALKFYYHLWFMLCDWVSVLAFQVDFHPLPLPLRPPSRFTPPKKYFFTLFEE